MMLTRFSATLAAHRRRLCHRPTSAPPDSELLAVLFGDAAPGGRVPVETPSSMAAVETSR
jgi:hypothetical protein